MCLKIWGIRCSLGAEVGVGKRTRTAGTKQALTCFPLHQPHVCRLRAFKGLHHFSNVALRDGDGKTTQHDGLALPLVTYVMPVVVLAIVAI